MRSRLALWAWLWLVCTALGAFFGTTLWLNYLTLGRDASFWASVQVSIAEWWVWALLAPLPIWTALRFPLTAPHRGRDIAVHLAAGVTVAAAKTLGERIVRIWLFGAAPYFLPSTLALHVLIYWAIVFLTIVAGYFRVSRARELRASQLEVRLREAQLELLRARLQPHFLFNSLNMIAELIHEDPERADRMLAGLSQLLRASLEVEHRPTVPLEEELALTRLFLDIHAERFGDRLRVDVTAPADCGTLQVPHFVLQPIVENAIVHGIAPSAEGGAIHVTAARRDGRLELIVEDSGQGLREAGQGGGVGLANTRARLEALHGDRAALTIEARPGGGTRVVIRLPPGAE